jgi:neutral ceramidase
VFTFLSSPVPKDLLFFHFSDFLMPKHLLFPLVLSLCLLLVATVVAKVEILPAEVQANASPWLIGRGIYDITGPAAQTGMMGYAMVNQSTTGIHYRLRARAFVIADGEQRVAFVSTDSCMIFTSIKREVVKALQRKYGGLYSYANVMLSGIHTHSGPGGYAEYSLYDITTLGFFEDNWRTIINGIVAAIEQAHNNMVAGKIFVNSGELLDSNINRSPTAYANNPAAEKAKYRYNVDKTMTVLKFVDTAGKELGMVNWFAVHGTSMTNRNTLISGDNKGYASYLFEKYKNGKNTLPGTGSFVAAFAQSNEGDVSPNTRGAFCDNGSPCEVAHSTCGGYSENCHGYGPGANQFQSTQIIGTNQFKKALELYEKATQEVVGPLQFVHSFVDMSNVTVLPEWTGLNSSVRTCMAALGDSFAGGTTDGPGDFNFKQGTNSSTTNEYWNFLAHFLSEPSDEQIKCQYPKPILLNTGGIDLPAPWTPKILPLQIFRVGQIVIVGVPGEFSTMSGRRLRDSVQKALSSAGVTAVPVIAGLSNAYSHYITTHEEYVVQRYEGASTLYGPYTLNAYQQEYTKLAVAMVKGTPVPPGPTPPDLSGRTFTFLPPVIEDLPPLFGHFGQIDVDVKSSYHLNETVKVSFWGANPRNDFRTQSTFLTVERKNGSSWEVVLTDGDWDTKFMWESVWITQSRITITWDIALDTPPGQYRIQTFGTSKDIWGTLTPYTGTSSVFNVLPL